MSVIRKLGYVIIAVSLTLIVWVSALEWVTYDVNHYMNEFEKQQWVPATGLDQVNLSYAATEIIGYLKGEKDHFQTIAVKDGVLQPLYDERELTHMEDVLHLFNLARFLRKISVATMILLTLLAVKWDPLWKKSWLRMVLYAALGNVGALLGLALLIRMDFTKYFTYFHLIFFNNDLWILDPQRHVLIQMLPESFFRNTAIKIGLVAMGSLLVLGVPAGVSAKLLERKQHMEGRKA